MDFKEFLFAALIAIVGGSFGAAIVNQIGDGIKQRRTRKNELADKADDTDDTIEKLCDDVESVKQLNHTMQQALKYILLDRILTLGRKYIDEEVVDFDDRRRLNEMHDVYHNGLGGNGDATSIMEEVNELPLKRA